MAVLGGVTSRILFSFLSPFALVDMLATFIADAVRPDGPLGGKTSDADND